MNSHLLLLFLIEKQFPLEQKSQPRHRVTIKTFIIMSVAISVSLYLNW